MPHPHGSAAAAHRGRLVAVFAISLTILVVEIVGSVVSNSLALLADAGHVLADVAGIGLALLAIWFAGRPATAGRTFGYLRLEILAAKSAKSPPPTTRAAAAKRSSRAKAKKPEEAPAASPKRSARAPVKKKAPARAPAKRTRG